MEITAIKNQYGAWVIAAIINGYRESGQYYGYTKREAIQEFKREHKAQ